MSAELLRRAAKEMRERAEAAIDACGAEPWQADLGFPGYIVTTADGGRVMEDGTEETAEHVASWHPAVALAVADWLDIEAHEERQVWDGTRYCVSRYAETVARAYLGEGSR